MSNKDLVLFKAFLQQIGYDYESNEILMKKEFGKKQLKIALVDFEEKRYLAYGMPITNQEIVNFLNELNDGFEIKFQTDNPIRSYRYF